MQEHRLAAIMFTDIVGYTALMGKDEDHTLQIVEKNKHIHLKCFHKYKGSLVKEMGMASLPALTVLWNQFDVPLKYTI